jgi:hypothetical protein
MKEIPLTRGYVALVDDEDYERLSKNKWYVVVSNPKTVPIIYAARSVHSPRSQGSHMQQIWMHREVLGLPRTRTPEQADHRNGETLDNRRNNLRVATRSQNGGNRRKSGGCVSIFKGVDIFKPNGRWRAMIGRNGAKKHLGYFGTEKEAALAYNAAALARWGEFARLNEV